MLCLCRVGWTGVLILILLLTNWVTLRKLFKSPELAFSVGKMEIKFMLDNSCQALSSVPGTE